MQSRVDTSATDATSAAGDTASCASAQSPIANTRRRNKIIVRRSKSNTPAPSKMRTSVSMPKVRNIDSFVTLNIINALALFRELCLDFSLHVTWLTRNCSVIAKGCTHSFCAPGATCSNSGKKASKTETDRLLMSDSVHF